MFKLVMAAVENMVVGKEYYEHCLNHVRNHTSPFSHGVCQPCSHDWDSGDSKIKGSKPDISDSNTGMLYQSSQAKAN